MASATAVWVFEFDDAAAGDPAEAGGKLAGLHRLRRGGLAVPEGFVVSVAAFRAGRWSRERPAR